VARYTLNGQEVWWIHNDGMILNAFERVEISRRLISLMYDSFHILGSDSIVPVTSDHLLLQ
jgi:hypothetical protein